MAAQKVVYYWKELFRYIGSVLQEYSRRKKTESEPLLESLCDKLQHCTRCLLRLIDCLPTSPEECEEVPSEDIFQLLLKVENLLSITQSKYSKCSAKLLAVQSGSAIGCNPSTQLVQACPTTSHIRTFAGRNKIEIDIDSVRFLRSISMKWEEIANLFGVSRSTVLRRCKEAGYSDPFITLSDENLKRLVADLKRDYTDSGKCCML